MIQSMPAMLWPGNNQPFEGVKKNKAKAVIRIGVHYRESYNNIFI